MLPRVGLNERGGANMTEEAEWDLWMSEVPWSEVAGLQRPLRDGSPQGRRRRPPDRRGDARPSRGSSLGTGFQGVSLTRLAGHAADGLDTSALRRPFDIDHNIDGLSDGPVGNPLGHLTDQVL